MKECIAAGTILEEKDGEGKLSKQIVATVYEEVDPKEESAVSGSGATEGKKSVVLKYKDFAYTEDIVAPLGFEDIAAVATLTVPGLNGHEDITLSAPMIVKYSKTRSFERNANTVVSVSIRYEM